MTQPMTLKPIATVRDGVVVRLRCRCGAREAHRTVPIGCWEFTRRDRPTLVIRHDAAALFAIVCCYCFDTYTDRP